MLKTKLAIIILVILAFFVGMFLFEVIFEIKEILEILSKLNK